MNGFTSQLIRCIRVVKNILLIRQSMNWVLLLFPSSSSLLKEKMSKTMELGENQNAIRLHSQKDHLLKQTYLKGYSLKQSTLKTYLERSMSWEYQIANIDFDHYNTWYHYKDSRILTLWICIFWPAVLLSNYYEQSHRRNLVHQRSSWFKYRWIGSDSSNDYR